jgi:hypothetical protein
MICGCGGRDQRTNALSGIIPRELEQEIANTNCAPRGGAHAHVIRDLSSFSMSFKDEMAKDLAFLRRESLDIYNRIHSIAEDVEFVNQVCKHYSDYPVVRECNLPHLIKKITAVIS